MTVVKQDLKTEALKLAREALEDTLTGDLTPYQAAKTITAIREALAEQPAQQQAYEQANPLGGPAKVFAAMADAIRAGDDYHAVLRQYGYAEAQQQEPVAWVCHGVNDQHDVDFYENEINAIPVGTMLYTSPPASKPWVGLDNTDLAVCDTDGVQLARYWERVLREKNA